jgi:hypothetical protein
MSRTRRLIRSAGSTVFLMLLVLMVGCGGHRLRVGSVAGPGTRVSGGASTVPTTTATTEGQAPDLVKDFFIREHPPGVFAVYRVIAFVNAESQVPLFDGHGKISGFLPESIVRDSVATSVYNGLLAVAEQVGEPVATRDAAARQLQALRGRDVAQHVWQVGAEDVLGSGLTVVKVPREYSHPR